MKKVKSKAVKKRGKQSKSLALAFSQRGEDLVLNEIKKEIMQNPEIMKQFSPDGKDISAEGGED